MDHNLARTRRKFRSTGVASRHRPTPASDEYRQAHHRQATEQSDDAQHHGGDPDDADDRQFAADRDVRLHARGTVGPHDDDGPVTSGRLPAAQASARWRPARRITVWAEDAGRRRPPPARFTAYIAWSAARSAWSGSSVVSARWTPTLAPIVTSWPAIRNGRS